jgi:DNA invertase Pin-like site-specific DNA recombinase
MMKTQASTDTKRVALYLRVSLDDGRQTVENQRLQLTDFCNASGWQVVMEFTDQKSGKSLDRPGLQKMKAAASKREFDHLVFWDLSRLSRGGVSETLRLLEELRAWGVGWRSYQEAYIDALGPFAEVVIALLSTIAKMEREKIRERTLAGLQRARKQGRIGGRPKAVDDYKMVQKIEGLRADGQSIRKIAATVGASPTTVQKLLHTSWAS